MKIDWKQVAASDGYRSLKAAYIHDVQKKNRPKKELLKQFFWVLNRAKHYAYHENVKLEDVLDYWESRRDYWWLIYYQECDQPKTNTGLLKRSKETQWLYTPPYRTPKERFEMIRFRRQRLARFNRKHVMGKKPRRSRSL